MHYTRLIRSLVEESVGACLGGYSVESVLASRSSDDDLIRGTLIRTVCDFRFRSTVNSTRAWQTSVQDELEEFAQSLMNVQDLDEETAQRMMEEFLAEYFFQLIQQQPGRPGSLPEDSFIQSYLDLSGGDGLSWEDERRVQTNFMRNIPKSLVKLAKLIGRAGNTDLISSGHFLTAAKSDISGITVGDDLSNLLPSEIALLSCKQTQNIFFRNYAVKRLQVFASASSGSEKAVRHQDGPVIICLDTSDSMQGRPAEVARILTMAVTIVAQRRKRKVLVVKYADRHHLFTVENLRRQRNALMDYLAVYSGGGNNEEEMFDWLFTTVLPREAGDFDSADILCLSDFGWTPLSDNVFNIINENKGNGMKFYGLDITGVGLNENTFSWQTGMLGGSHTPGEVIDSTWIWKEGGKCCIEEKNGNHIPVVHRNNKKPRR